MIDTIALFYGASIFIGASSATAVLLQVPPQIAQPDDWMDKIFGPFGALALSVIGLYLAGKFILNLIKKNDALVKERMDEYRKTIEELRRDKKG